MSVALAIAVALGVGAIADHAPPNALDPDECAMCHPEIAAEWARSRHAVAYTNELFQGEFRSRRTAWCVTCHAPGVRDPVTVRDDDPAARRGVDCVACHVRDGAMISAKRAPDSPHDTTPESGFGTAEYCARCHEFNFPILDDSGMRVRDTHVAMQETVSQFSRGPYGTRDGGCAGCHQATAEGHLFPGSHDVEMVRGAVAIGACVRDGALSVGIGNRRAGHNLPTGGVHRHMKLWVWRSSAPQNLFEGFIGRRFRPRPDGGKDKVADTTIPTWTTRWFDVPLGELGGSSAQPINVELRYVYTRDDAAAAHASAPNSVVVTTRRLSVRRIRPCGEHRDLWMLWELFLSS